MQIAIVLFDRFTSLDALGPYQVLTCLPGAEVLFVTERPGTIPVSERVVFDEKYVTAAGVSSDMALALAGRIAGDQTAQAIQLGIEYDPQPPTTRAPRTAPPPRSSPPCAPSPVDPDRLPGPCEAYPG